MTQPNTCLLWGEVVANEPLRGDGSGWYCFASTRAGGAYCATIEAIYLLKPLQDWQKVQVTNYLIGERILGVQEPRLTSALVERLIKRIKTLPIAERADRLLRFLASQVGTLGRCVQLRDNDDTGAAALGWSASTTADEIWSLVDFLEENRWIKNKTVHSHGVDLFISPQGFTHLESMDKAATSSDQAFVAMWFDASMDDVFERGIRQGIEAAGYRAVRIDREQHNNKIDDELIAAIRRSRFVVADFTQGKTGARGGVYYEAGFAHGLNLPVIFTVREDCIGTVHFDTRQYNHIVWRDPADFATQLSHRISATIGDGPHRRPQA